MGLYHGLPTARHLCGCGGGVCVRVSAFRALHFFFFFFFTRIKSTQSLGEHAKEHVPGINQLITRKQKNIDYPRRHQAPHIFLQAHEGRECNFHGGKYKRQGGAFSNY